MECFLNFRSTEILDNYNIRSKVVAITTDGASNFKCAMKRHGDDFETFDQLSAAPDEENEDEELFQMDFDDLNAKWCPANELFNDDSAVMPLDGPDDSIENSDVSNDCFHTAGLPDQIVEKVVDDLDEVVMLPSRIDCSSHNLNSIGKTDSFNALKSDHLYSSQYISVFKKLNAIWKSNSTRLGRETFNNFLGDFKIIKPHRIRWNRIYDAVSSLFQLPLVFLKWDFFY